MFVSDLTKKSKMPVLMHFPQERCISMLGFALTVEGLSYS